VSVIRFDKPVWKQVYSNNTLTKSLFSGNTKQWEWYNLVDVFSANQTMNLSCLKLFSRSVGEAKKEIEVLVFLYLKKRKRNAI